MKDKIIKLLGGYTPQEVETVVEQLTYKPVEIRGFLTNNKQQ